MRKAGHYHAKRGLLLTLLLLVATSGGSVAYLETYLANRVAGLVRLLETADIAQVYFTRVKLAHRQRFGS